MTTIQLEGNDIQKFLDMAINQFNLKIEVIDDIKLPNISKDRKKRWDRVDKELRNLKTIDANAGDELREALELLGKSVEVGDYKNARDEYLTKKYAL